MTNLFKFILLRFYESKKFQGGRGFNSPNSLIPGYGLDFHYLILGWFVLISSFFLFPLIKVSESEGAVFGPSLLLVKETYFFT